MATSNNGHNEQTAIAEALEATNSEPVQAADVPLTVQQRTERCQAVIQDALNQYRCVVESTYSVEQLGPALQIRPGNVNLRAIEEKS